MSHTHAGSGKYSELHEALGVLHFGRLALLPTVASVRRNMAPFVPERRTMLAAGNGRFPTQHLVSARVTSREGRFKNLHYSHVLLPDKVEYIC